MQNNPKNTKSETLFISDLHLSETQAELTQAFFSLIEREAQNPNLENLYILGDFFDYWLGDDDKSDYAKFIQQALLSLSQSGVNIYFMHGNRDFTLGKTFAQACGGELLSEYTVINLYGRSTLLLHGDSLCTDDVEYQKYKRVIRHPLILGALLKSPRMFREALAKKARRESAANKTGKYEPKFDVNEELIKQTFEFWSVQQIIHGHTHRPNIHKYELGGSENAHVVSRVVRRYVLGDWGKENKAWALRASADQIKQETFLLS